MANKSKRNISANPGLYIHIPYCDTKCGYCDFYSITNHSTRKDFIPALQKEMELYARPPFSGALFDTIYFGGGTPSLLEPSELEQIFNRLHALFRFAEDCEITLEANPGTLNAEKLEAYKKLGVNRLSIGIQSFDEGELKMLGRIHSADDARRSVEKARSAGIDNISVDLIFALPGQSLETWQSNMAEALKLEPQHISAYNLIFESGTQFYKKMLAGEIVPKGENEEWLFFSRTMETLEKGGISQYEVSNYAADESLYSRHNCKYWDHTPYLSFGPSAHSYWNGKRWSNMRSAAGYIKKLEEGILPLDFEESLDEATLRFERMMLGLRTRYGVDLAGFREHFQQPPDSYYPGVIETLLENRYAEIKDGFLRLTKKGLMICDEIVARFAPA